MNETLTDEIQWRCGICHEPITDLATGSIVFDYEEINTYEAARDAWEQANPGPIYSGAALIDHPYGLHVMATHDTPCRDPDDGSTYWYGLDRVRTWRDLVQTIGHLSGKGWFEFYDWEAFVFSFDRPT